MRGRGFTLIQFIIVLTIMSIMAAIGIIRMPSVNLFRANTFASTLAHDLALTKTLSMSENQRYRIVIGASSYQIQDQTGTAIIHPETRTAAISYPTGVSISPTTTVIFDSLGKPYNGSSIALTSTLTLTVTSSGVSQTVSITPQTGFIQ